LLSLSRGDEEEVDGEDEAEEEDGEDEAGEDVEVGDVNAAL
jgi:hypothetical protein